MGTRTGLEDITPSERSDRASQEAYGFTHRWDTNRKLQMHKEEKQADTDTDNSMLVQREGGGQESVKGANYLATEETDGGWAHSAYAGDLSRSRTREAKQPY